MRLSSLLAPFSWRNDNKPHVCQVTDQELKYAKSLKCSSPILCHHSPFPKCQTFPENVFHPIQLVLSNSDFCSFNTGFQGILSKVKWCFTQYTSYTRRKTKSYREREVQTTAKPKQKKPLIKEPTFISTLTWQYHIGNWLMVFHVLDMVGWSGEWLVVW